MTALISSRDTRLHNGVERSRTVLSGATIYKGALVGENSAGTVQPMAASVSGGLRCLGVAQKTVVGDGILTMPIKAGFAEYHNSASADALTSADVGHVVYAADDQTVAKTDGGGTRNVAGVLMDLDYDSAKPIVAVGMARTSAPDAVVVSLEKISSKAADAEVARFVAPYAGKIVRFTTVLNNALAAADATVTAKIGTTAVTGGVATITQSASAAGDVDSATPTDLNVFAEGDVISLTVGGGSTATGTLNAQLVLQPL